jgi:hypothetical protein
MNAISSTFDLFGLQNTSGGVSAEADKLEDWIRQSVNHFMQPRLGLLIPEIESLGDVSEPVVKNETVDAAIRFAYCLPRFGPLPEVSLDPDGEISFDWIGPSGREMFSVSVNDQNRLAYAGWFGEKSRTHGIEQLAEGCPQEILRGIQRATRSHTQRTV